MNESIEERANLTRGHMGKETHISICKIHVSLQHYEAQLSRS